MIQPESLGLLPSVFAVPQDSLHDFSRMMRCGLHFLCSQAGCLPLDRLHRVQLKLGVLLPERLQPPGELLPEIRAPLRRPIPCPILDLESLVCQISYAGGMMCCLPLAECAVRLSQRALCLCNHPSHQVLDLVEIPSSRLSFSSSCSLDPLYFREQRFAVAFDRLDTVAIKLPAQPLLDVLDSHAQLSTGSPHLVALGQPLLVSSIRDLRYLLTLASASSRPLFPGCLLLLLRSSAAGTSAGSLSL
jgi:hypothetical protein